MRLTAWLVVGIAVFAVACGGSDDDADEVAPTATVAAGGTAPSEASLIEWVEEYWADYQAGNYAAAYEKLPDEQRQRCSFGEFSGDLVMSRTLLGEGFAQAEVEVRNIEINGDTASFDTALVLQGVELVSSQGLEAHFGQGEWEGVAHAPEACR